MASELYETLGIPPNAPQEEIRKAYKKQALLTHPDRLPPGATPSEKAASEEKFRKVNNAYEVLNDPQNRRLYDMHGVWPPPEPEYPSRPSHRHHTSSRRHTYHHDPFSDPFFSRSFVFTDPFVLFESIFRDMHPGPHHHSRHRRPSSWDDPFHFDPFQERRAHRFPETDSFMNSMHRNMMAPFGTSLFSAFPSISMSMPRESGRWTSESTMSQTINGVTHTIHKRRDWDGNEHVTRIYPDGRQVITINGVEQQDQGRLPPTSPGPDPRHVPPPPIMDYSNNQERIPPPPPPPPYPSAAAAGGRYNAPPLEANYSDHHSHRSHRSARHHTTDPRRYNPGGNMYNNEFAEPVEHRPHHKKHWWSRH